MGTTSEKLQKLLTTKENIRQAIINKGVNISESDTFSSYASKISQIEVGENTALNVNTVNKLDSGWQFGLITTSSNTKISPSISDYNGVSSFENVTIPHDWSIHQPFNSNSPASCRGGYLDGGYAWYKRTINLDTSQSSKQIYLYFDGIYMTSNVYINGNLVKQNYNGYNPFYVDITSHLNFDGNDTLSVFVENRQPSSRWYSGSGIYRNVYLLVCNKVNIGAVDIQITTPNLEEEFKNTGSVSTKIDMSIINSDTTSTSAIIKNSIYFNNKLINYSSDALTLSTGTNAFSTTVIVGNPKLWDINSPYLYMLKTEIILNNEIIYSKETKFGYRYFKFDPNKGFSLNGNVIKLQGVCLHHDNGCLGAIVNKSAIKRKLDLLREMGCNSIRTSHNTASSEFLELAAEEGFLIMEEFFDCWSRGKSTYDFGQYFDDHYQEVIETTIKRDRNNPAIIMWSIGNEIVELKIDVAAATSHATMLKNCIKQYDTTRPVTLADDSGGDSNSLQTSVLLDVVGFNYRGQGTFETVHKNYPDMCLFGSETISATGSRGIYAYDGVNHQCSATDQANKMYDYARLYHKFSWLAGQYIWTGIDYIGEPKPFEATSAYPARSSYFGAIDLAGFKKDGFYSLKSLWKDEPMVSITPHTWNGYNSGDQVNLTLYYNKVSSIELFINGTSVFTQGSISLNDTYGAPLRKAGKQVTYASGTLVLNGYDPKGNLVAQDVVRTSGTPNRIELIADKSTVNKDSDDLVFVECNILDANGYFCGTATNEITFSVTGGTIVGTDNGDPTSTLSFQSNIKPAFSGKALVVVKPDNNVGELVITANASGLSEDSVSVIKSTVTSIKPTPSQVFVNNDGTTEGDTPIHATGISLAQHELTLKEGNTATLSYSITPSNGEYESIVFSSNNANATVDSSSGLVTAVSNGSAIITVTLTANGSTYTDTCTITIEAREYVTGVTLSPKTLNVEAGQWSDRINYTLTGNEYTSISWENSDDSKATWDVYSQKVQGVMAGETIITCKVIANGNTYTDTCTVTVTEATTTHYSITNNLTNVTTNNSANSINANSNYTATLTPDSGYDLSTVTVVMGEVNITDDSYSNGVINIANVTGNIVITATATIKPSGQYSDYEIYLDASQHGSDVNVWKDLSGKGNDVTLNGFTHDGSTNGWINNSLVFNGTTTYGLCNKFKPFSTSSVTANGINFEIEATIEFNDDSNARNKYYIGLMEEVRPWNGLCVAINDSVGRENVIFFLGEKVAYYDGLDNNTPINLKITFGKDNYFKVSANGIEKQSLLVSNTSNRTEQPLYLGANIINKVVTRFGKMKLSKFSFKYIK